jgi:hypothetical protein
MKAWLDRTARAGRGRTADAARAVFESLGAEKSPGSCIRCHSVDDVGTPEQPILTVNWRSRHPDVGVRAFTRFEHGPHFKFERFRDCASCHAIDSIDDDDVAAWKASYAGGSTDESMFAPSFGPIARASCVECHGPHGAGNQCLACHNYHVGRFERLLDPPSIGGPAP